MATIHPTAIVEAGAELGVNVEIGPFCFVGTRARLADGVRLLPHAVVTGQTAIGARTHVHPHAVLGGPAQYRGDSGEGARLVIGADNIIREHVTMSAGTTKFGGLTEVGSGGYFMAACHVGHDCRVGDGVMVSNGAQLAGHVHLGDGAILGGLSAIHQFARIGKGAMLGGLSGAEGDVIPYGLAMGDRASLVGLNLVGLKRRGLSREQLRALRAAFDAIFHGDGALVERAEKAGTRWKDVPEVGEIVSFILADSKRHICTPRRADGASGG